MTEGSPGSPGAADAKKGVLKRAPLRSSIACIRCRKSKIKCNNTGSDAPCETCIRNGKECTYPEPATITPKRPEPPAGIKTEPGSERKRLRRIDDITKLDGAVPAAVFAEEVLSAPYLSETLWSQIFDIYRLHFATELPFLHLATLKEKMGSKFRAKQSDTSPAINLVLLGILTLTARFHSTLVSYVTTPRTAAPAQSGGPHKLQPVKPGQDGHAASEYYAEVLTKALGPLRICMSEASVERVQAFLMLGLYEWTQARPKTGGLGAWMYVGFAIRLAQAMSLGDGDKEVTKPFHRRPIGPPPKKKALEPQMIIAREIRRRSMFSCMIMDRLLGCGKGRVSTINADDLKIQLPCSEVDFDLSHDVYTGFLNSTPEDVERALPNDNVLSRFVRLINIWGEISKWSFAGGRFTEHHAPWNKESTFFQLRKKLDAYYEELPPLFQWSPSNYYKHENHHASSTYVSLHMLSAVCRIMLHREYIPFIPIRCDKPIGPLDEPTFPQGDEPPGFWEDSAEEVFVAARDIVDLIDITRDKLPISALVVFAVWTAAFVGIYTIWFPHMDTRRHMLPSDEDVGANCEMDVIKHGPTSVTYKTLNQMSVWLRMAETYSNYFREMVTFYDKVKQDYEKFTGKALFNTANERVVSVGLGGGGLEEWREENSKIVNNGEILTTDEDRHSFSRDSTIEPGSSVGPDSGYPTDTKTPVSTSLGFTPINGAHPHSQQYPSQQQDSAMGGDSRADGLPSAVSESSTNWRFAQPPPPSQSQHQHSPSHSSSYAMPSPQLAHAPAALTATTPPASGIPNLPRYGQIAEVADYLTQNECLPWANAPGSVGQFALGAEESSLAESGNVFWGADPAAAKGK